VTPSQQHALESVRAAAQEALVSGELVDFLTELERVRLELVVAAAKAPRFEPAAQAEEPNRLLSVEEAARRIGMSRWWVRENKDALPVVRLGGGRYRFSEKGIERWIDRRSRLSY